MPFCSWCRTFIEKVKPRVRCAECRTLFCQKCGEELGGNCPFCLKEGKEDTLRLEPAPMQS